MGTYIVRVADKNELVYFGAADSLNILRWLVDQVADPAECQYASVARGGLMWGPACGFYRTCTDPDEADIDETDEFNEKLFAGAKFDEMLGVNFVLDKLRWRPLGQIIYPL